MPCHALPCHALPAPPSTSPAPRPPARPAHSRHARRPPAPPRASPRPAAQRGEGAVIARDRNKAHDVWSLAPAEAGGWYRFQTNYDHENPVPVADDRRTPGVKSMEAMGQGAVSLPRIYSALLEPPVFNDHTDYTGLYEPAAGTFNSTIWVRSSARH